MADHPLQVAADRYVLKMADVVLDSVGAAREAVDLERLESALARRDVDGAMFALADALEAAERVLTGATKPKAAEDTDPKRGLEAVIAETVAAGGRAVELCVVGAPRVSVRGSPAEEGWEKRLTPEEVAAVKQYTSGGYKRLNESLREGRPLDPDDQVLFDALESVIKKAGQYTQPVTVLRGISLHGKGPVTGAEIALRPEGVSESEVIANGIQRWAEEKFTPGSTVTMKGFQSSSFYTDPALDAATSRSNPGVVFEIRAKRGAYLQKLTQYDDEAELLLGHNEAFKVVRVERGQFEVGDYGDIRERTVVILEQR